MTTGTGSDAPAPGASEEFLRAVLPLTGEWFWETDRAGRHTYCSPSVEGILGRRPAEYLGLPAAQFVHEEDRPKVAELLERGIGERRGWSGVVLRWPHREGTVRWLESTAVPVLDAAGEVAGFRGADRDITRQMRTEMALREAFSLAANEHARVESILAALADGVSIQTPDFRVTYQNPVHEGYIGSHRGELCHQAYEGRDAVCEGCPVALTFADGQVHHALRSLGEGETARHFDIVASPLRDAAGRVIAGIEVARDVTAAARIEARLRESEERFRELADALPEGIYECDAGGTITYLNRAAHAILGSAPGGLLGTDILLLLDPGDRERARGRMERLVGGQEPGDHAEYRARRRDGTTFPVLVQSAAIVRGGGAAGLRGLFSDLTERKRIEAELLKAEKLESIGILAGGIAHDFNNILTGVLGNISLARLRLAPGDPVGARLGEAEKATLHARELTQQLLTFARGGAPVRRPLALETLVRESATFALRGSSVRLDFRFAPDLPAVDADEGQLGQVVQNLVLNACQAMPAGGTVGIGIDTAEPAPGGPTPLPPGRWVRLTVTDEGTGIDPEHLPRIFDPYFTTKTQGTGLGLAVTYSVVRNHGGLVSAASTPGAGTTFTVLLPASAAAPSRREASPAGAVPGRGRILVMDDDEMVRAVAGAMLAECGYESAFAGEGAEAVALWRREREAGRPFDAVIMDLTIPGGMGGLAAVAALREIDPAVKVVVSSGYSNDPAMADPAHYGFSGVVTKPYRVHELGAALRRVLSGEEP